VGEGQPQIIVRGSELHVMERIRLGACERLPVLRILEREFDPRCKPASALERSDRAPNAG